jgi:hypothetical protein
MRAKIIALYRPAPGLPIALYGYFCDYGRSYVRPLAILIVTVAAGVLPFWMHFGIPRFYLGESLTKRV